MVQADDLLFSYHPPILTSFQQYYSARPILPPYHDAKSPTRSKKRKEEKKTKNKSPPGGGSPRNDCAKFCLKRMIYEEVVCTPK